MKISREIKTAIIVLGGIFLLIIGYSYLKSDPIFSSDRTYYAVYDNVEGLAMGTPITINGFQIGKVIQISFLDGTGKLLVTLSVEDDFTFSKNSEAVLYDTGIIGGKSIQIIPVFDSDGAAVSGDTLSSSIRPGLTELLTQKLTPLQQMLENIIHSADSMLLGVNNILDDATRENIKRSIHNLNITTSNFRESSGVLNTFLTKNKRKLDSAVVHIGNMTRNLSSVSEQLSGVEYEKITDNIQIAAANLNTIIAKVENGEGSVGKLLKDEELYETLTGSSKELELLLEDMRINPKRYVHFSLFGKRPKPYEPPVEEENK